MTTLKMKAVHNAGWTTTVLPASSAIWRAVSPHRISLSFLSGKAAQGQGRVMFGKMEPLSGTGLESTSKNTGETGFLAEGGAESGAVDADLARIISAWPSLSASRRAAIAALAEGAGS